MQKILQGDKIVLGACYYPEHWDEALWAEDLVRMKQNGIFVVRVAEFAWNKIEPAEGAFDFSFFDRFLDAAQKAGVSVIFSTPTATPPAWLTNQFPEVLNARQDGTLYRHGCRRHYNYNSPVYQRFAARIVEEEARHYGKHPAIIGWQIDNEINCETDEFYSESDTAAFREFLKNKYGTLGKLNDAWGAVFWNQTYTAWAEVYVPRTTISDSTNPHQVLDYIRFVSASARRWCNMQSDIIRRYTKPEDFITTNGMFGSLDNHAMRKESLDFYTYDSYPNFAFLLEKAKWLDDANDMDLKDRKWSRNLAEVRSISPERFGIMEQQSGPNGWNTRMEAPSPRPGQMTLWTMQSVAHGADYVGYFRWRTSWIGTEIYWHGILDYSNRGNRRLAELNGIWKKTENLAELAGSKYQAAFGVVKDYDNEWDARLDAWHRRTARASEAGIFQAAQITHTPFDYVYIDDDTTAAALAPYPVLFYPHAVIMTEKRAKLLEDYAANGGKLVLGCRAGYKDIHGRCPMRNMPGLLQNVCGADVVDFSFISPADGEIACDWDGAKIVSAVFNDVVEAVSGAKIIATYTSGYFAGQGALTEKSFGKGKVYYYGSCFDRAAAKTFLEKLDLASPWKNVVEAPPCCEIAVRAKAGKDGKTDQVFIFVLNYTAEKAAVTVKREARELLTGKTVNGTMELDAYGCAVLVFCTKQKT